MRCNYGFTLTDVNMKLVKNDNEELVDPTLFQQVVGSPRYLSNSRPYIVFVVGIISRFMSEPRRFHLLAAKILMRSIKGTLYHGILFHENVNGTATSLVTYSDVDWCGDKQDKKDTSEYLFKLLDVPISWCTKKKSVVAPSTCESEYTEGCLATCQAIQVIWLCVERTEDKSL